MLIGRPHVDVLHIDKLIPPNIDVTIKLMPNDDKFLFMSADGDNLGPKVVIIKINLIVATKQMSDATDMVHRALVRERNMRLLYTLVIMKLVAIPAGSSTMCLDNIFMGGLLDLVMMGFVSDTAFAGSYTELRTISRTSRFSKWICSVTACGCGGSDTNRTLLRRYIIPIILPSKSSLDSTRATAV